MAYYYLFDPFYRRIRELEKEVSRLSKALRECRRIAQEEDDSPDQQIVDLVNEVTKG